MPDSLNEPMAGSSPAPSAAAQLFKRQSSLVVAFALGLLAVLALGYIYRRYSLTFAINADNANDVLEGQAFWQGNVLLRHWVLTTISFYTTDVLFDAFGVALRGLDPVLLHEVPTATFCVTLGLAMWLAGRRFHGRCGVIAAATTFVLMGLPTRMAAMIYLLGAFHGATVLYIFLAFAAIDEGTADEASLPLWRISLFTLSLTAAYIADTMTLYVAIVPLLAISGLRIKASGKATRNDKFIIGGTLLAGLLATAFLHLVVLIGGFKCQQNTGTLNATFVSFADLPQNISWTIEGLLAICGADFFGQPLNLDTLIEILDLIPLAILLYTLNTTLRGLIRQDRRVDRLSGVLAAGMLINLISYVMSTSPFKLDSIRYLVPFFFMASVLVGRLVGASFPRQKRLYIALAIAGTLGVIHVARQMRAPYADSEARPLADWLQAHHLKNGYGAYWCCADTTVYARGRVRVRPIIGENGKLKPFMWASDRDWYNTPANFAVINDIQNASVSERELRNTFGPYAQRYVVNKYTVFVYSHDLTPLLTPLPPEQ